MELKIDLSESVQQIRTLNSLDHHQELYLTLTASATDQVQFELDQR